MSDRNRTAGYQDRWDSRGSGQNPDADWGRSQSYRRQPGQQQQRQGRQPYQGVAYQRQPCPQQTQRQQTTGNQTRTQSQGRRSRPAEAAPLGVIGAAPAAARPSAAARIPATGGAAPSQPPASANPYSTTSELPGAPRKRSIVKPILLTLFALLLVGGVVLGAFLLHRPKVTVTVNGQEVSVPKDSTLDDVKSKLGISVTPGRLLAVDGSVIEEDGGMEQVVTVNGEELSESDYAGFRFSANGTDVRFDDGRDETEEFDVSEEREPYETAGTDELTLNDYWTGSIHLYQHGQEGVTTTRTGRISGIEVTEETQQRQDERFVIYTAQPPAGENVIALTFDDGPWDESTDAILDVLEANDAKASFFTIGNQVAGHAAQVRRESELGCSVYTHTWDHASGSGEGVNLTYMSPDEQVSEVQRGYDALREVLGSEPAHIFRAPGGNLYGSIIETLRPYADAEIGWDVDTEDWRRPGEDAIYEAIMSAESGQVVLMHDGGGDRSQTVAAVRRAVPELIERGYRLVTIDELLEYGVPDGV